MSSTRTTLEGLEEIRPTVHIIAPPVSAVFQGSGGGGGSALTGLDEFPEKNREHAPAPETTRLETLLASAESKIEELTSENREALDREASATARATAAAGAQAQVCMCV